MSKADRKLRRQINHNQQQESTGNTMSTPETVAPTVTTEERKFTEKQLRHLNNLKAEVSKAQHAVNMHISYLATEHDISSDGTWSIVDDGFVRVVTSQKDTNGADATGPT